MKKILFVLASAFILAALIGAYFIGKKSMPQQSIFQKCPYIFYSKESTIEYEGQLINVKNLAVKDLRSSNELVLSGDCLAKRMSVSSSGMVYYDVGIKSEESIWVMDLAKKTKQIFLSSNNYFSGSGSEKYKHYAANPCVSPDGKKILFEGNVTEYRVIFCVNSDGTGLRMVTRDKGAHYGSPSWSPDGKYIAYDCVTCSGVREDGTPICSNFNIWVSKEDGSEQKIISSQDMVSNHRPMWRPKGDRWLLFYSVIGGKNSIRAVLLDNDNEIKRMVNIADDGYDNLNPRWSPDGEYVIFESIRPYTILNSTTYDKDIYCVKFDPDMPQIARSLANKGLNEEHPFWSEISSSKPWGDDLLGYLSDGIVLDSAKSGPGI